MEALTGRHGGGARPSTTWARRSPRDRDPRGAAAGENGREDATTARRMKTVHVQYFAILREQRGAAEESWRPQAATPAAAVRGTARAAPLFPARRAGPGGGQRRVRRRLRAASGRRHASCLFRRWPGAEPWTFRFPPEPIDAAALRAALAGPAGPGACVTFEGWVRDRNEGRPVRALEYEAYAPLARKGGRAHPGRSRRRSSRSSPRRVHPAHRRPASGRPGYLGGGHGRTPRRGLRRLPLHHRPGQGAGADLEAGALRRRQHRLDQATDRLKLPDCRLTGSRCDPGIRLQLCPNHSPTSD